MQMQLKKNHYPHVRIQKLLSACAKDYNLVDFSNEDRFGDSVKIFPRFNCPKNLNNFSVIGSCNSLVCILNHDCLFRNHNNLYEFLIWNPSIIKYKKLPLEPVDDEHKRILRLHLGFGYDPVNNDYKVLRIVDFWDLEYFEVKVYSMQAHSWRRVEDRWPCNWESRISWWQWPCHRESRISSRPAFSNGVIHWLVESITGARSLVTFDLITKKFELQTVPFKLQWCTGLQVLGGSLCVSQHTEA
jgi:F-box interacting protein